MHRRVGIIIIVYSRTIGQLIHKKEGSTGLKMDKEQGCVGSTEEARFCEAWVIFQV